MERKRGRTSTGCLASYVVRERESLWTLRGHVRVIIVVNNGPKIGTKNRVARPPT